MMPSDLEPDLSISSLRKSFEDRGRASLRRRLLAAFVIAVALGGFSGIAWYAYTKGKESNGEAVVPLIKAESKPVKVRPEKPGGMEVPNQDKLVYNRLTPGGPPPPVERLLLPPETPVAKIEAPPPKAAPAPPSKAAPPPAPRIERPRDAREDRPHPPAPRVDQPKPGSTVAGKDSKLAAVAPAAGTYRVQLAALRSPEGARRAWELLRKAHGDLLGGLKPTVVRADLGAKGIFYRLRVGPVRDRAAGRKLCAKLKARKVGCLVVKP